MPCWTIILRTCIRSWIRHFWYFSYVLCIMYFANMSQVFWKYILDWWLGSENLRSKNTMESGNQHFVYQNLATGAPKTTKSSGFTPLCLVAHFPCHVILSTEQQFMKLSGAKCNDQVQDIHSQRVMGCQWLVIIQSPSSQLVVWLGC